MHVQDIHAASLRLAARRKPDGEAPSFCFALSCRRHAHSARSKRCAPLLSQLDYKVAAAWSQPPSGSTTHEPWSSWSSVHLPRAGATHGAHDECVRDLQSSAGWVRQARRRELVCRSLLSHEQAGCWRGRRHAFRVTAHGGAGGSAEPLWLRRCSVRCSKCVCKSCAALPRWCGGCTVGSTEPVSRAATVCKPQHGVTRCDLLLAGLSG